MSPTQTGTSSDENVMRARCCCAVTWITASRGTGGNLGARVDVASRGAANDRYSARNQAQFALPADLRRTGSDRGWGKQEHPARRRIFAQAAQIRRLGAGSRTGRSQGGASEQDLAL